MKIIYGTKNRGKLESMRHHLKALDLELVDLNDYDVKDFHVEESGSSALENAVIKARAYYKLLRMPVLSADTALYFEGVDDVDQPGLYARRVGGRELTDEEMVEHYSKLATKYGGKIKAKYVNALCLIINGNIFPIDDERIHSEYFYIVEKAHGTVTPGFPLDRLSVDVNTMKYFNDLDVKQHNRFEEVMSEVLESLND